jgi:hypothetical protein
MTTPRRSVLALWTVACLAAPFPAASQSEDQKPPPATEKKPRVKQEKPESPPTPRREAPRTGPGEERPKSDVPVSFPVDI